MDLKRYLLILLGSSKGIDADLDPIADPQFGVNYVDGNGIFLGTFYSHFSTQEIHEMLLHRPAIIIYDISNRNNWDMNLPSKYYKGLFPEIDEIIPKVIIDENDDKVGSVTKEDSLTNVNDIIDKLASNNFDPKCLTETEKQILDNFAD